MVCRGAFPGSYRGHAGTQELAGSILRCGRLVSDGGKRRKHMAGIGNFGAHWGTLRWDNAMVHATPFNTKQRSLHTSLRFDDLVGWLSGLLSQVEANAFPSYRRTSL